LSHIIVYAYMPPFPTIQRCHLNRLTIHNSNYFSVLLFYCLTEFSVSVMFNNH